MKINNKVNPLVAWTRKYRNPPRVLIPLPPAGNGININIIIVAWNSFFHCLCFVCGGVHI